MIKLSLIAAFGILLFSSQINALPCTVSGNLQPKVAAKLVKTVGNTDIYRVQEEGIRYVAIGQIYILGNAKVKDSLSVCFAYHYSAIGPKKLSIRIERISDTPKFDRNYAMSLIGDGQKLDMDPVMSMFKRPEYSYELYGEAIESKWFDLLLKAKDSAIFIGDTKIEITPAIKEEMKDFSTSMSLKVADLDALLP